ncbi:hypothetical protein GCK72_008971 [Caenorhabditis remanei]|uniref:Tr-type G domain-containing protein n=1 Tax=Caenorhabditis remanei TaxID=31234 RepID=A0A6A5H2L5_CAERE|nr:hypothetical protein GCK72_008971 [Caenorhabditis remanei]KAF1760722.1 hypothetical protein GCK72_008971 [Caenorhabditis remanei]
MVERCVEPLKEPIQKKKKESGSAEKSTGVLRSPVICVIGRDDTEESAILDYIRRTNVREGEAGGITQQIGATEVAAEAIQMCCKHTKGFVIETMEIPGFLIINKGHESYPKLRTLRGSSLCDFAIVIVDMQHGLEPQTVESLKLLIKEQTPFVIALNRFDLLREYKSKPYNDVYQLLRSQQQHFRSEFEEKMEKIEAQFAEQEIKVTLSNSLDAVNPNYVCMVPISATKGVGIGNLMAFIVNQTQTEYAQRLTFSEKLDANVMEVKQITGLGTSINVILVNGTMRAGDILVLTGTDGAIVTKVQKLLMPKPMREMQTKNSYVHFTKVKGSCGVKVLAKNLEKVVSGLPVYVTDREEEIDYLRQEANNQHVNALRASKKNQEGVFVKASTAGSLEALLDFLKSEKIPYSNAKYVFCDDSTPNDGYSSTSSTSPIDRPREMQPSSSSAIQQHQPKNSTHQNIQMRQTTRSEIVPKPSTLGNQTVILKERRHALTDIMDSEESMNKKKEESELNKLKKLTEELSEKIAVSREQIDLLKVQLQNSTIASDMEEQRLIQRIRELEQNHQAELNQLGVVWNERELVIAGQMFLIEALFPPIQPGGENAEPENPVS